MSGERSQAEHAIWPGGQVGLACGSGSWRQVLGVGMRKPPKCPLLTWARVGLCVLVRIQDAADVCAWCGLSLRLGNIQPYDSTPVTCVEIACSMGHMVTPCALMHDTGPGSVPRCLFCTSVSVMDLKPFLSASWKASPRQVRPCRPSGVGGVQPCLMVPLLPDKQSNSASLETLLALLQAEGAKIEEDTEVRLDSLGGRPRASLGLGSHRAVSRTGNPHLMAAGACVRAGVWPGGQQGSQELALGGRAGTRGQAAIRRGL